MPYNYRKTAYELVKEVAHSFGKDGRQFHYSEVVNYVKTHYPDCPFKESTFYLHLRGDYRRTWRGQSDIFPHYIRELF